MTRALTRLSLPFQPMASLAIRGRNRPASNGHVLWDAPFVLMDRLFRPVGNRQAIEFERGPRVFKSGKPRLVIRQRCGEFLDFLSKTAFLSYHAFGKVADVVYRIMASHILLLEEIGGAAFGFGKDRDQNVGAGHLFASRRLKVDHRALNDALETTGRLGILQAVGDETLKVGFDRALEIVAQLVEIDVAARITAPASRSSISASNSCRVFVTSLIGESERAVQRPLKAAGESGDADLRFAARLASNSEPSLHLRKTAFLFRRGPIRPCHRRQGRTQTSSRTRRRDMRSWLVRSEARAPWVSLVTCDSQIGDGRLRASCASSSQISPLRSNFRSLLAVRPRGDWRCRMHQMPSSRIWIL
jgi:hypothetical protein